VLGPKRYPCFPVLPAFKDFPRVGFGGKNCPVPFHCPLDVPTIFFDPSAWRILYRSLRQPFLYAACFTLQPSVPYHKLVCHDSLISAFSNPCVLCVSLVTSAHSGAFSSLPCLTGLGFDTWNCHFCTSLPLLPTSGNPTVVFSIFLVVPQPAT